MTTLSFVWMEHEVFELASATVSGRDHVRVGRNNQDALAWEARDGALVAVVCDGCGSRPRSELGAQLGARVVLSSCLKALVDDPALEAPARLIERVQVRTLETLRALTELVCAPARAPAFVHDALLFTIVGLVITPARTLAFAAGDGALAINGELLALGPFPDNSPPYLCAALLSPEHAARGRLRALARLPTDELRSALIASDGALELEARRDRHVPGTTKKLGPLRQFWTDDRYFNNPDAMRRRLALANREVARALPGGGLRREHGLLPDDTTIIAIRRRAKLTPETA